MLNKLLVCFISFSDVRGGAAKAAARIKHAVELNNVEVAYVVAEQKDPASNSIGPNKLNSYFHFVLRAFTHIILKLIPNANTGKKSLNIFSSKHVLNSIKNYKLLHIHWINNETLSLTSLVKLSQHKRLVLTLHDEWLFSGVEHYSNDFSKNLNSSRQTEVISSLDTLKINQSIKEWKFSQVKRMQNTWFTVPSTWMLKQAIQSGFFDNHNIKVIPNTVPTDVFFKREPKLFRQKLGLNKSDFIIAFGAIDALNNPLKGFKFLNEALQQLKESHVLDQSRIQLLVFGNKQAGQNICGYNTAYLGQVKQPEKVAEIYSCASVVIVPSLVESFGQVAAESLACETPVVAFNYSGITDIIKHKENGYLATPYQASDLVKGVEWVYQLSAQKKELVAKSGRTHVKGNFSEKAVAKKFIELYQLQSY